MHILAVSAYLYVLAVLFAMFEIEAEGKHGWAEKFPTWYRSSGWAKVYTIFTNKPLTGYHAALFFVPLIILAWPMVATSTMSWHGFFHSLSQYFAWIIIWDFAWFVLNPNYGIKKFRRGSIWWLSHEPWFGRMPSSYISSFAAAGAFAAISGGIRGGWLQSVSLLAQQLGWYAVFTLLLALVGSPLFAKYYAAMRTRDERSQAGIFHS